MYCVKKMSDDMYYVGGSDRRLALFESVYPIPRGVSYNSYMILDEKTVLIDTVDQSITELFYENVERVLNGRPLDYLIINHMEPDHCRAIPGILTRWPNVQIVCTQKALQFISQFYPIDVTAQATVVKDGSTLNTGRHTFSFATAPMVHWPEVMVTYDAATKTLFSADAFGTFGALPGNIYADELNFEAEWLDDARRYYTNIVGKYGPQVNALLKKAAALDIAQICPLHGPVWRENLGWFIDKYAKWASYQPEERAVMIAYASVYGDTENAANILATALADKGVRNIAMYDVSTVHSSVIVAEAFRCSHLVFASTTYNMAIFINMEEALNDIAAHALQNRTVALIENGSWAPAAGKLMSELIGGLKQMTLIGAPVSLRSSVKDDTRAQLEALADAIYVSLTEQEAVC